MAIKMIFEEFSMEWELRTAEGHLYRVFLIGRIMIITYDDYSPF